MEVLTHPQVRLATREDATSLVPLIHRVLRVSNTPDYGFENVERVVGHFTGEGLEEMIDRNYTLVAECDGILVGTASLGTSSTLKDIAIRSFFVDPNLQRRGIGALLLAHIEAQARQDGLEILPVRSSLAGQPFYAAQGYVAIEDIWDGEEQTIRMEKWL